jgi:hypothetical protein
MSTCFGNSNDTLAGVTYEPSTDWNGIDEVQWKRIAGQSELH